MTDVETRLELLYFKLFDNCNVRCNMCTCWELPPSSLRVEAVGELLARVLELSPVRVRFTGGEPLLARGLPQLVAMASSSGAFCTVITNGALLSRRIDALRDAGLDEVVVSLDGLASTHDRIRRTAGLFENCLAGIDAAQERGIQFAVNTVIQRDNVNELRDLAILLEQMDPPPRWWHLIPVRDCEQLVPDREDVRIAIEEIREVVSRIGSTELVVSPDPFASGDVTACSVPSYTAFVDAQTGDMFGCNMLAYAEKPIGNLWSASPSDGWNSDAARGLRRECATAEHVACRRCDEGSRSMNRFLRRGTR